jgi:hypothetical protein
MHGDGHALDEYARDQHGTQQAEQRGEGSSPPRGCDGWRDGQERVGGVHVLAESRACHRDAATRRRPAPYRPAPGLACATIPRPSSTVM